jgi:acetoin:2,6-dichlorophenolindophenol oxidoreductase subunit alpha
MELKKSDLLRFYRSMLALRAVDNRLVPLKLKDLVMNGFHPYAGEEAVAVGVCSFLRPDDVVVSTHRPQGHALAKGASMESIFCEMLGRMGGPSNGLGGPMQWVDVDTSFFCGSIVGSGVSYATGLALAAQREGKGRVVACFFGDGASNTGSFHEGLNLAAIWRLPVLYVCENNQYGEAMPAKLFVSAPRIGARGASYGIKGRTVDGMDVKKVAAAAGEAIAGLRKGKGPVFIEAVTYRYRGHYLGDPENYRTKAEIEAWRKKDPIDRLRRELLRTWKVGAAALAEMEAEVERLADEAQERALARPKPTLDFAVANVLEPVAGRDA